jgi:hypothetical protein
MLDISELFLYNPQAQRQTKSQIPLQVFRPASAVDTCMQVPLDTHE